MNKVVVESFTMDHTKVKAPFVRKCGRIETPKGDMVTKFDLRFTQPNKETISMWKLQRHVPIWGKRICKASIK